MFAIFCWLASTLALADERPSTATAGVQILAPPLAMPGLDRERTIRVYLPPSYNTSKRRYPVLYMHDGQNLFDDATSYIGEWGVDENMDALAKSNGIEVIVVGIDHGGDKRIAEQGPWTNPRYGASEGKQYLDFIVNTVKPFIDGKFRTRPGREDTGIMGASLGALSSQYAMYEYPDVFGKAGLFSPSYDFSDEVYPFVAARHLPAGTRLYLVIGGKEGREPLFNVANVWKMVAQLQAAGDPDVALYSAVRAGAEHNETFWRSEFPKAMLYLFGKPAEPVRDPALKVMSFNIRCGSCEKPDDINHWSRRKNLVADLIGSQQPDLVGLQEAELFQVRDLVAMLGDYEWIGVGRDDGKEKGEANAILFRKSRTELLTQKTLWLSATPERIGKGWDAALNRTVSIAQLRDRDSKRKFFLLNTHFDYLGEQARLESSRLIGSLARSLAGTRPVIVTGDFNFTRKSAGYGIMTGQFRDAEQVSATPAQGGTISFNGFGRSIEPDNKIDFILVNEDVEVVSHRIITDLYQGRYPSDHYPVQAVLRFR
jgi:predicted alpha/beta superfamily hydrolase/endonuclease/exonuclease/phosphatase family metal-dependent hydrolase